jgi:hypothetical protein
MKQPTGAHPEGEQVAQRDGPVRRDGVVHCGVQGAQHRDAGQFGQQVVDRLVQPEDALLDQDHRCDGGDRLGHRADPEDGVPGHGLVAVDGPAADALDVRLAAPADHRDQAGPGSTLDVSGHDVVHAGEPRLPKP